MPRAILDRIGVIVKITAYVQFLKRQNAIKVLQKTENLRRKAYANILVVGAI